MSDSIPPADTDLVAIRAEIDRIDAEILALIHARTAQVDRLRGLKGTSPLRMRPGREAAILRRQLAAHDGLQDPGIPAGAIVRIWRELINALTLRQAPFSVVMNPPADSPGLWDIVRDHFGTQVPITLADTAPGVIRAVVESPAVIGVVPWPQPDDASHWWPLLIGQDPARPRIIGRVPFGPRGNARACPRDALLVARLLPDSTGADRSLLAIDLDQDVSRGRMQTILAAAGLTLVSVCGDLDAGPGAGNLQLVEVEGFVTDTDPRLLELTTRPDALMPRVLVLGAYPLPLATGGREAEAGKGTGT